MATLDVLAGSAELLIVMEYVHGEPLARLVSRVLERRGRILRNPKIRVFYDTVVDQVLGVDTGGVTGVGLWNTRTSERHVVACTGFFAAIGHTPNTDLFAGQLELHDNGYIRTKPGTAHTSVPGVFACGDVQDFTYRQAVTAAGSGCMAALDAERWMTLEGGEG